MLDDLLNVKMTVLSCYLKAASSSEAIPMIRNVSPSDCP